MADGKLPLSEVQAVLMRLYHGKSEKKIHPKGKEDFVGRSLVCTPYEGCYGQAGWVVCVNGSPPRGTVIITAPSRLQDFILFWDGFRARRLPNGFEATETLWRFWRDYLKEAKAPMELFLPDRKPD